MRGVLHLLQLLQLQRPKRGAVTAASTVHTVITAQKKLQHPRILKRPFYKGSRARCSRVQQLQHPKRAKKQARAAPLRAHMKSPKTRERQAFRGLPFRKWDVGNRKCAGFHKKRFKCIRRNPGLRFASATRHSRGSRPSAGAPVRPTLAGAHSGSLLVAQELLAPRTSTGSPRGALTRHSRSTRA